MPDVPRPRAPDLYVERLELKAGRRDVRQLRFLLLDAVRLVWEASHADVVSISLLQAFVALLSAAQVLIAKVALTSLLAGGGRGTSVREALPAFALLAVVSAISNAGGAFQSQRQRLLGELVTRASWRRMLDVTVTVPLETYDSPVFYDHMQRVKGNGLTQPINVVQGLLGILGGIVGATGLVVALLLVQPVLVPILLIAGLPLFLLQRRGGRLEFAFALEQTPGLRARLALEQVLTGRQEAKEVRAFAVAHELRHRWEGHYDTFLVALRRKVRKRLWLSLSATVVSAVVGTSALGVLLLLVEREQITLAAAAATVAALGLLGRKLEQLVAGVGVILESGLFLRDLQDFLALGPDGRDAIGMEPDGDIAAAGFDELRVNGVSFTYPGADRPALEDVDLVVRRGEVLALVGENGSGKTTLSKLLAHLYQPSTGTVTWDGVDVAELDRKRVRSATAVLFQDFVHYELTLRENVVLGRPSRPVTADALASAADIAGITDLVGTLRDGWATPLGRRFTGGSDLSGGQWQRVAMARAVFRDSPFVVLDEPTAALDPRAEAALFAQLRGLLAGRTVVLVSHRFASVRHADRIGVLSEGRLVELGDHEELMALGGHYSEMFTLQARAFTE